MLAVNYNHNDVAVTIAEILILQVIEPLKRVNSRKMVGQYPEAEKFSLTACL